MGHETAVLHLAPPTGAAGASITADPPVAPLVAPAPAVYPPDARRTVTPEEFSSSRPDPVADGPDAVLATLRRRLAKEMFRLFLRPGDERLGRVAGVADCLADLGPDVSVTVELLAARDAVHRECVAEGYECGCGRRDCGLVPLPMLGVSHAHPAHLHDHV